MGNLAKTSRGSIVGLLAGVGVAVPFRALPFRAFGAGASCVAFTKFSLVLPRFGIALFSST